MARRTVTEAGCAQPLNLGFDIEQQDQDSLEGSQAACLSKRMKTPWPAPNLTLGGMPILKMPKSRRRRDQGESLEFGFPESKLGG